MDPHPLDTERLIGWMSFALGLSALQPNDSTFFSLVEASKIPYVWIGLFCILGLLLVLTTYTASFRCRIVLLTGLLLTWGSSAGLIISVGPMGAFGAVGIVVCAHIVLMLIKKVRDA